MAIKTFINNRSRDMNPIPRFGCSQINFLRSRTCLNSLEVSYTQDFLSNNLNHYLGTPKCGLGEGGHLGSLFSSLKMEDD